MTITQKIITKGERKAVVTKVSDHRWLVAYGWADQTVVERYRGDQPAFHEKRASAMTSANYWVNQSK